MLDFTLMFRRPNNLLLTMIYFYLLVYLVIHIDVTTAPVSLTPISGASLVGVWFTCVVSSLPALPFEDFDGCQAKLV